MNDKEFGFRKLLKLEHRRGTNNSYLLPNQFPPRNYVSPLKLIEISRLWDNYSWIIQNVFKTNQWQLIWVHQTFKIQRQKGGPNNSDFLENWFPPDIMSPLFYLYKFQDSAKCTPESCRMHSNLINYNEFGSIKLLKSKYRMGDQIIQIFWKIGFPQKLGLPYFICTNFKTLQKVLLNHAECIQI